jgi:hypothetical protein
MDLVAVEFPVHGDPAVGEVDGEEDGGAGRSGADGKGTSVEFMGRNP